MFANRFKTIIGDRSQREFAKSLNISPSTLWEYLKGRIPPADLVARICEQYGVSEKWILSGDGPMLREEPAGRPVMTLTEKPDFDRELMAETIELVEEVAIEAELEFEPADKAKLIMLLYDEFSENATVPERRRNTVLRFAQMRDSAGTG